MKTTCSFTRQMFVGALAIALCGMVSVASAGSVPQVVTVLRVKGFARYSTDNKSWTQLKVGQVLDPGSVIQTAEDSTVDIMMAAPGATTQATPSHVNMPANVTGQFGYTGAAGSPAVAEEGGTDKGNVIHIYPSTVLGIDKLMVQKTGMEEVNETQLDLRAGQILGNVKKLSSSSRYEVKLPNGVAGIRGTVYLVTATGAVDVLEGSVIVSYVGSGGKLVTQTINAGQSFNPFIDSSGHPVQTASDNPQSPQPLSPTVVNQLLALYNNIPTNPQNTPASQYTKGPADNTTTVYISPN